MDGSSFTCTVVSKQCNNFILLDAHCKLVYCAEIAKLLGQKLELDWIIWVEGLQGLALAALHSCSTPFLSALEKLLSKLVILELVTFLGVAKLARLDSAASGNRFIGGPCQESRVKVCSIIVVRNIVVLATEAVAARLSDAVLVRSDGFNVNL